MLCQCRCGKEAKPGNKYIKGHSKRKLPSEEKSYCGCGCGAEIKQGNKYVVGHARIGKKNSEEHQAKIFAANKGRKCSEETKNKISLNNGSRSLETRAKMSEAKKNYYEENPGIRKGKNNPMFGRTHSDDAKRRIANFNTTQRVFSEETRKKIKEKRGGKNSNFWYGGINGKPYAPGNTKELKDRVRARDGHTCQECGKVWDKTEKSFIPHHIDYHKKNHVFWNRITLCHSCHPKSNFNRPFWTSHFYELIANNCIKRILNS